MPTSVYFLTSQTILSLLSIIVQTVHNVHDVLNVGQVSETDQCRVSLCPCTPSSPPSCTAPGSRTAHTKEIIGNHMLSNLKMFLRFGELTCVPFPPSLIWVQIHWCIPPAYHGRWFTTQKFVP